MKLISKRLEIRALNQSQLMWRVEEPHRLVQALRLNGPIQPLEDHMGRVFRYKADRIANNNAQLLFLTYYAIITLYPRNIIGYVGFKGVPDADGWIEVGYWIDDVFQNKGYMTEALMLIEGLFDKMSEVKGIQAFTSISNRSSQKVLKKCGYSLSHKERDMMLWEKNLTRRE